MFARVKKSGRHAYLQIVQNRREGTKTMQRVVDRIIELTEPLPIVKTKNWVVYGALLGHLF